MEKSIVFSFFMSGNDQYGRPYCYETLRLQWETAEIFGFTFDMQMRYLVYMRYLWCV